MPSSHVSTGSFPTARVNDPDCPPRQEEPKALFVITSGERVGRVIPFSQPGQVVSLGRGPECVAQFRSQSISRLHATAVWVGSQYIITDAGSTNGTFVNDRRLARSTSLDNGDQVRLGPEVSMRFSILEVQEARALILAGEGTERDPLTGVFGRSYLEHALDDEIAKARFADTPLSVMMIDVDRFKSINDRYGHLAGDEVLASLAHRMRSLIRSTDVLARYGGEEFVIIAPDTSLYDAHVLAERVRLGVEATTFSWSNRALRITISIGVSSIACCTREIDRLPLLSLADQRTYLAKRTRNAVVSEGGTTALSTRSRSSDSATLSSR